MLWIGNMDDRRKGLWISNRSDTADFTKRKRRKCNEEWLCGQPTWEIYTYQRCMGVQPITLLTHVNSSDDLLHSDV